MTSPSGCPDPATHGRASLSPDRAGRFGQGLPYRGGLRRPRAAEDHPRGGHVAVVDRPAAITGPLPHGEGQSRADVAAVRAAPLLLAQSLRAQILRRAAATRQPFPPALSTFLARQAFPAAIPPRMEGFPIARKTTMREADNDG